MHGAVLGAATDAAPRAPGALVWGVLLGAVLVAVGGWLLWRQWRRGAALSASLHRATHQLDALRWRDPLTGLLTRPGFEGQLDDAVHESTSGGRAASLLYLGLDNFRPINDGYGTKIGDAVLARVARRLEALADPPLPTCRAAGDEFVILVPGGSELAMKLAQRALTEIGRTMKLEGTELRLTASCGIASYPEHGSRPRLIAHAALAMRSVKLGGGCGHALFDPSMAVDLRGQAELLQDLRAAIDRGELSLVYQPKIDARSLQITAAEALLRWQHPRRGMISPALFVPLAERHGLIRPIGAWVIDQACRQAAIWREQGLRMRMAVNLSGHQLRQDDLVEHIERCIRRHDLRPERLTVEITESVAMEDTATTRAAFERLRQAGLHVSIDDFGTGHSSLAALRKLPAAELKIDRAFVTDLEHSADARSIAQAIVQMAHTLHLRVVAEGVENERQRDLLVGMGCDELQGFLFARPMTPQSLALWAETDADSGPAEAAFRPSLFGPTLPAELGER